MTSPERLIRCATCSADWSAGLFTEGCDECFGGALEKPCPQCGGRCSGVLIRAVDDSRDYGRGVWVGGCNFDGAMRLMQGWLASIDAPGSLLDGTLAVLNRARAEPHLSPEALADPLWREAQLWTTLHASLGGSVELEVDQGQTVVVHGDVPRFRPLVFSARYAATDSAPYRQEYHGSSVRIGEVACKLGRCEVVAFFDAEARQRAADTIRVALSGPGGQPGAWSPHWPDVAAWVAEDRAHRRGALSWLRRLVWSTLLPTSSS